MLVDKALESTCVVGVRMCKGDRARSKLGVIQDAVRRFGCRIAGHRMTTGQRRRVDRQPFVRWYADENSLACTGTYEKQIQAFGVEGRDQPASALGSSRRR